MRAWLVRGIVILLVLGLTAGGAGAVYVRGQIDPSGPDGPELTVTIPEGASTARIAGILEEKGVVKSARAFRMYVRVKGEGPFQAGTYRLRKPQAFASLVKALGAGPVITYDKLTIPEGYTLAQVAERVGKMPGRSAERFLEVARSGEVRSELEPDDPTNLEGLLFPDTYLFERDDDERAILTRLVATFDRVASELGAHEAQARTGLDAYDAVIVASLVEREARVDKDRGPIASVIYNRLERGMLLQIDATVIYALGRHTTRVLFKDLEVDSPYNTYKVKGLPPTPIAAPGRSALRAALDPPNTDFLYYVVVEPDGSHAFGRTGAEHARNIQTARANGVR